MWKSENTISVVVLDEKVMGYRPRSLLRKRWLSIMEDLDRMGIQEWWEVVQDQVKWSEIVMAAKILREYEMQIGEWINIVYY